MSEVNRETALYDALWLLSRSHPDQFASSTTLMRRIPKMSQITSSAPLGGNEPTIFSIPGYVDRLLLVAEAYGLRVWGSHAWDVIMSLIERHRQSFWQEETIAEWGGPADRNRERRAYRKRYHHIAPDTRRAVYERDGHHCLLCGTTDNLQIDHLIPLTHGGKTVMSNLRTLCRSCNSRAGGYLGFEGLQRANEKRSQRKT